MAKEPGFVYGDSVETLTHNARKTAALIWLMLPPTLLSTLIHIVDPDINGWQGLASFSALWSVAIFAFLLYPFLCLCLCALLNSGWPVFLGTTGLFSLCVGFLMTIFGSGSSAVADRLLTLAGCTGIAVLTVLLAVIPAAAMGWPHTLFGRGSETHP